MNRRPSTPNAATMLARLIEANLSERVEALESDMASTETRVRALEEEVEKHPVTVDVTPSPDLTAPAMDAFYEACYHRAFTPGGDYGDHDAAVREAIEAVVVLVERASRERPEAA